MDAESPRNRRKLVAVSVAIVVAVVSLTWATPVEARRKRRKKPSPSAIKAAELAKTADRVDRTGKFSEAAALFLLAHELVPTHTPYLYRHARSAWLAGDTAAAVSALQRVLAAHKLTPAFKQQVQLDLAQVHAVHLKRRAEKARLAAAAPPPIAEASGRTGPGPAVPARRIDPNAGRTASTAPPLTHGATGSTAMPTAPSAPKPKPPTGPITTIRGKKAIAAQPAGAAKPVAKPKPEKRCVIVKKIVVVKAPDKPKAAAKSTEKAKPKAGPKTAARVAAKAPAKKDGPPPRFRASKYRTPPKLRKPGFRRPGRPRSSIVRDKPGSRIRYRPERRDRAVQVAQSGGSGGNSTAATASFIVAGVAVAAGIVLAIAANGQENELAKSRLGGSDAFDLTRIDKPTAVDRTNETITLWNGAMAAGATGLFATGVGAWLMSDAEDEETAKRSRWRRRQ